MALSKAHVAFGEKLRLWKEHPSVMMRELFNTEPDPWQVDVLEAFPHHPRMALQAPLCVESEVWTPAGLKTWGQIQPGDEVFAEDGSPTMVMQRFNAGVVPLFRVHFCDGTSVRCTGDHLWDVQTGYDRKVGKRRAVSTNDLAASRIKSKNSVHGRLKREWNIPIHGPVQAPMAKAPLNPYLFGLWLGDGVASEPTIICPDEAIRAEITGLGFRYSRRSTGHNSAIRILGVEPMLRATGIFGCRSYEKSIPYIYKTGSIEQRLGVLRGLMDADGTVAKNGQTYLATSSRQLADDTIWLARSLGYYATLSGPYKINDGKNRDSYRVTVSGPICPFLAATRKRARWKKPEAWRYTRSIDRIEPDGEGQAMCVEIAHSGHCFLANDFVVTHNCKGPGKTATLAVLAWNFLFTRRDPKVAATSISGDNLRDNLWAEMAKWQQKAPILQQLFEWTTTRIFFKQHPETWFMSARTWPRSGNAEAQANTLAGLHADYIMFILDESGGIPDSVMVAAEAALSSCIEGHILQAGNPTHLVGPLYRAARSWAAKDGRWHVTEITGDPDDPKRSPRVHVDWARDMINEFGRDNPWVLVNVFGKFPPSSINALIGIDEVEAAQKRAYREYDYDRQSKIMGVDVAREGDDSSVIMRRQGLQMFNPNKYRNLTGMQGGNIANRVWDEFGADACFVDATGGFGYTWIEALQQLGRAPIPVGFAEGAFQKEKYANRRAEMAMNFVDWIKGGGAIPPSLELAKALTNTTYTFKKDQIILEDKKLLKSRIGFSPDEFDAAILTFAAPVQAQRKRGFVSHSSIDSRYNPFAEVNGPLPQERDNAYDPFR